MFNCVDSALELYNNHVRGREESRYSAREVAAFFEVYFLGSTRIQDPLLLEFMHLKQVFLGGDENFLTRQELADLRELMRQLKLISLDLLPYMKVFTLNWDGVKEKSFEHDIQYFEDANSKVQEVVRHLSELVMRNNQSYEISNVQVLFEELQKLYGEKWGFVEKLGTALPLICKLKKTLAGGQESEIAADEWQNFGLLAVRGYVQYLRYNYFIKMNEKPGRGPEVIFVAKCFDDLFSYMGDMVRQKKPNQVLTRQELLEVVQALTKFMPQVKVSEKLLSEVMKMKQLFFGGSTELFTPEEFVKARKNVEALRQVTERFMAHLEIYTFVWKEKFENDAEKRKRFREAELNLMGLLKQLSEMFQVPYDLNSLQALATELAVLYPPETTQPSLMKFLQSYVPALAVSREILFSDTGSVIQVSQWGPLLKRFGQVYNQSLYWSYFLKPADISLQHGAGFQSLREFVSAVMGIANEILITKPAGKITYAEMEKLLLELRQAKLFPEDLGDESLRLLLRTVFERLLLEPELRLAGQTADGLSVKALNAFSESFAKWVEGQLLLQRIYEDSEQALLPQTLLQRLRASPESSSRAELVQAFESPQSRAVDANDRLYIATQGLSYTLRSASVVNSARIGSRFLIRAYSEDLKRIEDGTGVLKSEAETFFQGIRPVLISMDFITPSNTTFGNNRFLEANLFTPRGDGNNYFSFIEGVDLLIGLFSGIKINAEFEKKMSLSGQGCEVKIENGEERMSAACVVARQSSSTKELLSSMPQFRDYLLALPRCALEKIDDKECINSYEFVMANVLRASGDYFDPKGTVAKSAVSVLPHILQYIETVLQRYDRSGDGVLDTEEAMQAYPVFRAALSEFAEEDDEKTLRAILGWLLVNGRPPENAWDYARFFSTFRGHEKNWKIRADRARLASILGLISNSSQAPEKPKSDRRFH